MAGEDTFLCGVPEEERKVIWADVQVLQLKLQEEREKVSSLETKIARKKDKYKQKVRRLEQQIDTEKDRLNAGHDAEMATLARRNAKEKERLGEEIDNLRREVLAAKDVSKEWKRKWFETGESYKKKIALAEEDGVKRQEEHAHQVFSLKGRINELEIKMDELQKRHDKAVECNWAYFEKKAGVSGNEEVWMIVDSCVQEKRRLEEASSLREKRLREKNAQLEAEVKDTKRRQNRGLKEFYEDKFNEMAAEIKERETRIRAMEAELGTERDKATRMKNDLARRVEQLDIRKGSMEEALRSRKENEQFLKTKLDEMVDKQNGYQIVEREITRLDGLLKEKEKMVEELTNNLTKKDSKLKILRSERKWMRKECGNVHALKKTSHVSQPPQDKVFDPVGSSECNADLATL